MKTGLKRELNLLDATTLVIGSMIGSGIFIAPSLMANYIQTPGLIILLWLVGGILTIFGSLSYAELAAAMPRSGGQYVFLKEAYSPLIAFLYGWTLFLVIQSGFIAAVAVAFAKYLGVFIPSLSETNIIFTLGSFSLNTAQIVAILSIILLTFVNILGVKLGAVVQNVFTILKISAILALIVFSFLFSNGSVKNFSPIFTPIVPEALGISFFAALAVAMSKALFAYDAWNSVTFAAEEIKKPDVNLPRALILGTTTTALIYTLVTMAYIYVVPIDKMAIVPDNRIAAEVSYIVLGNAGLIFITIAILISTFGCNNGLILAGPRVYYAMANDQLFFKKAQMVHPKFQTPSVSLWYQCLWACLLTLTGTYSDLLTYTAFASLLFNLLTVVGLFILRKKLKDLPRPYKTTGYPLTPILYILVALFFIIYIFIGDIRNSGFGLLIILTGIPVYIFMKKKIVDNNG
ncbi:MAG: amino acid permease-associated region [Ignavibacteriae bacterium]|nr:MAG: amino acid permease-associated region [Ignavibacteriota bacterium]